MTLNASPTDHFAGRDAGATIDRAFLANLRRGLVGKRGFDDPQSSPWVRADWLAPGRGCACPADGRPVAPAELSCYWKGFRWRTVVGQCPGCGTVWFTRPTFEPDDYPGGDAGRRARQQFLSDMGAT